MYGFLQSLYSLDRPSNNKKTLSSVFIYFSKVSRSLSRFSFCFLSPLHFVLLLFLWKSQWMARSRVSFLDPLIAHPKPLTRIRKVILLFCLCGWGSFLLFGPDIYDGPVFICSRQKIVWTNIGKDHIHNLMPTWAAVCTSLHVCRIVGRSTQEQKKTSSFFFFFFLVSSGLYPSLSPPPFPHHHIKLALV